MKNIADVTLKLYALDECSTYEGAYFDADFESNSVSTTMNMETCQKLAWDRFYSSQSPIILVTTQTLSSGDDSPVNKVLCQSSEIKQLTGGATLIPSSDKMAKIKVASRSCLGNHPKARATKIMNINETLLHNPDLAVIDSKGFINYVKRFN